jgi:hypothetical protein
VEDPVVRNQLQQLCLSLIAPERTSVERCLSEAEKSTTEHHFRVIQLPMNLYESGGALIKINARDTVLSSASDVARRAGEPPLNAFTTTD